jgi:hypothetical protein
VHLYKITSGSNAIEEHREDQLMLYPNPVTESLHVEWKGPSKPVYYDIADLTGRTITSDILREQTIPVPHMAKGTYLIRFYNATGYREIHRFVKN